MLEPTPFSGRDLQLLKVFIEVDNAGGLTRAVPVLGMRLSAISQSLSELEEKIGATLCHRGKGGYRLTPEGQEAIVVAREFLDKAQFFYDKLLDIGMHNRGELRIGFPKETLLSPLNSLPKTLSGVTQSNPEIDIRLISASREELHTKLINNEIDLAYIIDPDVNIVSPIGSAWTEKMILVAHKRHAVFSNQGLAALTDSPVILPLIGSEPRIRRCFPHLNFTIAAATAEEALGYVLTGRHVGFISEYHISNLTEAHEIKIVKDFPQTLNVEVVLCENSSQYRSSARQRFLNHFAQHQMEVDSVTS